MIAARDAALHWIRRALDDAAGDDSNAESLHAIAESFGVPIEYLVEWIHSAEAREDGWTACEFRRIAEDYRPELKA